MNLIIDFYKELDTLNLIIFWGIIVVIVLLLIFSFILINKNKKLKKLVENNNKYEEEIPIKEKIEEENNKETIEEENNKETIEEIKTEPTIEENIDTQVEQNQSSLEVENDFIVEEHVLGYNKDNVSNIKKKEEISYTNNIEIPNKPYQRNVLREMSLSQTSPIGINRNVQIKDKKTEMIEDLEKSLNNKELNQQKNKETINEFNESHIDNQTKQKLNNIKNDLPRTTEIKEKMQPTIKEIIEERRILTNENNKYSESETKQTAKLDIELLNNKSLSNETKNKSSSEKYLEDVSRKLAAAEIPNEIERTNYELQQEEDAIISYKELMEKKDSIQTIDEEDAVISIEELMNRSTQQKETYKEEQKLYNLTEEEANDNFIKELKQFRNDL